MKENFFTKLFNHKDEPIDSTIQSFSVTENVTPNVISSPLQLEVIEVDTLEKEEETPSSIHTTLSMKQSYLLNHLFDMAYVAATADDAFYSPRPYKVAHHAAVAKKFDDKYNEDVSTCNENFERNKIALEKLSNYVTPRLQLFDKIKEIYPNFCLNYDKKMSPEDLKVYVENRKSLKKTIFVTNVYSDTVSSKEVLLDCKNKLSNVIDSEGFAKACHIEDNFVLSELDVFFDKLGKLPEEERTKFTNSTITSGENTVPILDYINRVKQERLSRIGQYSSIEQLYSKIPSATPSIKVVTKSDKSDKTDNDAR